MSVCKHLVVKLIVSLTLLFLITWSKVTNGIITMIYNYPWDIHIKDKKTYFTHSHQVTIRYYYKTSEKHGLLFEKCSTRLKIITKHSKLSF